MVVSTGFSLGPFSMVLCHATSSASCIIYYAVSMPECKRDRVLYALYSVVTPTYLEVARVALVATIL